MGQYYRALVEYEDRPIHVLDPHDYGNFYKLMEHSWIGNNFVNTIFRLIHNKKAKVAWVGDYTDEDGEFRNCYQQAWSKDSEGILRKGAYLVHPDFKFLVNHDTRQYLSINSYISTCTFDGWCVSPLPLLTATSNGGGGSYSGLNMKDVGKWTMNLLELMDSIPEGYLEVSFLFREAV